MLRPWEQVDSVWNEDNDWCSCKLYVVLGKTCDYFYDKGVFKMQGLISNMCYNLWVLFLCYFIITEVEVFCKRISSKTLAKNLKYLSLENLRMSGEEVR